MRVRFWREGEASELIFGGDLTEQVSKAESRKKSNSSKSKVPCKEAGTHSFFMGSRTLTRPGGIHHLMSTSLFGWLLSWKTGTGKLLIRAIQPQQP